mgnify:CR=1 FL=1
MALTIIQAGVYVQAADLSPLIKGLSCTRRQLPSHVASQNAGLSQIEIRG